MADAPVRVSITGGTTQATPQAQPAAQSQQSFVQRLLEFTITLQPNQQSGTPNTFAGTGSDTITLSGFRASVRLQDSGGINSRATVIIWGMAPSLMNQLSTLGMVFDMVQKNTITISAGDATNGLTPVFTGTILFGFGHYEDLPSASMHMECQVGQFSAINPVPASSFPQSTDVATIMSSLARQVPAGFENNGVTIQLPPSYFRGTVRDQIRAVARAAYINAELLSGSGGQQVLSIWPIGGSRTSIAGASVPQINKNTGMILTPSFGPNGFAIVKTLFNPQVAFGGVIAVQSDVTPQVNRDWVVQRMSMALDSLIPKGRWDATLVCYPKGFTAPVPPQGGS